MAKRAQMEILGLAIVVVLITLGGLFALVFMQRPVEEVHREYAAEALATDMVATMLRTTTDCHGQTIRDLLIDCAEGPTIWDCPENSCQFANDTIDGIFEDTLREWNVNFEFKVFTGSSTYTHFPLTRNCTQRKRAPFYFYTSMGTLNVWLDICG